MRLLLAVLLLACGSALAQTAQPVTKPFQVPRSIAMPAGKIYINTRTIPKAATGFRDENRVKIGCTGSAAACGLNAPLMPGATFGNFRVNCTRSHVNYDDPIVWPGQPGRTHPHLFFGNTTTNSSTDVTSTVTVGRSTCAGGRLNLSRYWVPAMVYHRPGHASDGTLIMPQSNVAYYKMDDFNPATTAVAETVWPPAGFHMIAGNPANTGNVPSSDGFFGCVSNTGTETQFNHIPTTAEATALGANQCVSLKMHVGFPQCWDGVSLGGILGKGHVGGSPTLADGCNHAGNPSFPVMIPQISFNIFYTVTNLADLDYWVLSSDWPTSYGFPKGHSLHGDWVNGWSSATSGWMPGLTGKSVTTVILEECLWAGNDCHSNLLGNPVGATDWWTLY